MASPIKPDPEQYCNECGVRLARKRFASGRLEDFGVFKRRKFCDQSCMSKAFDKRHRPDTKWAAAHHAARQQIPHGPCSRCGKENASDVHHKDGNFQNNLPANLERICRSCHVKEHRPRALCVVCGSPVKGLGYCGKHYQRFKKYGHPLVTKINQFTPRMRCAD